MMVAEVDQSIGHSCCRLWIASTVERNQQFSEHQIGHDSLQLAGRKTFRYLQKRNFTMP